MGGGILRPAQLGGDPPFQRNEPKETESREARPFAGFGTGSAESLLERRAKIGHVTGVGLAWGWLLVQQVWRYSVPSMLLPEGLQGVKESLRRLAPCANYFRLGKVARELRGAIGPR